ncbi:MAG TPA: hypothetical protein VGN52_06350 [Burkholderiales bacterium]|jgi:hypothetical protein
MSGVPQACIEGIVAKREIRHGWWYFELVAGGHAFHCVDTAGCVDAFSIYPGRAVRFYGRQSDEIRNYFVVQRAEYLGGRVLQGAAPAVDRRVSGL